MNITKILYAAFKSGKRYTRWRTDKLKTIGIAHKTHNNLIAQKTGSPLIEVRHVKISKNPKHIGSFAIIANQVSPL